MDNTLFSGGQNPEISPNFESSPPVDQGLQGAQSTQETPPETKKSSRNRYIVLGILIALILILIGAALAFYLMNNINHDSSDLSAANDSTESKEDNTIGAVAFEDLTKEEVVAFIQSRADDPDQIWPKNFVGQEIADAAVTDDNSATSNIRLIYSYDNIDELKQMAYEKYNPGSSLVDVDGAETNFKIEEYDYYAIVTPKRAQDTTECSHGYYTICDSLLSFKREYLNYFSEETTPNSFNDVAYVETRNPEVVEELLRTFCFMTSNANIYSYDFEEQDDRFILTLKCIGVGLDPEMVKEVDGKLDLSEAYAINLYLRRYAVDKSDGRVYEIPYKTEPEAAYFERIKSFPITETEASSLMDLLMHESE